MTASEAQNLYHQKTGARIVVGDIVKTFRGDEAEVVGLQPPPPLAATTGRVILRWNGDPKTDRPFYPGVINAAFGGRPKETLS